MPVDAPPAAVSADGQSAPIGETGCPSVKTGAPDHCAQLWAMTLAARQFFMVVASLSHRPGQPRTPAVRWCLRQPGATGHLWGQTSGGRSHPT